MKNAQLQQLGASVLWQGTQPAPRDDNAKQRNVTIEKRVNQTLWKICDYRSVHRTPAERDDNATTEQ